jgi:hypothetical protein
MTLANSAEAEDPGSSLDGLCRLVEFERNGARIEVTGVLLPDGRALLSAVVEPANAMAWSDFWTTDERGTLELALTKGCARITRLVDELRHLAFVPDCPADRQGIVDET